jgi:hypothetical protein
MYIIISDGKRIDKNNDNPITSQVIWVYKLILVQLPIVYNVHLTRIKRSSVDKEKVVF